MIPRLFQNQWLFQLFAPTTSGSLWMFQLLPSPISRNWRMFQLVAPPRRSFWIHSIDNWHLFCTICSRFCSALFRALFRFVHAAERQTDRQTDRQTHIRTDRQTDRTKSCMLWISLFCSTFCSEALSWFATGFVPALCSEFSSNLIPPNVMGLFWLCSTFCSRDRFPRKTYKTLCSEFLKSHFFYNL